MYAVGEQENISKIMVTHTIHEVAVSLAQPLDVFVVLPGYLPTHSMKQKVDNN